MSGAAALTDAQADQLGSALADLLASWWRQREAQRPVPVWRVDAFGLLLYLCWPGGEPVVTTPADEALALAAPVWEVISASLF